MTVPGDQLTDGNASHGLLLGLLRKFGGSVVLEREHYAQGCTNEHGEWHGVTLEPLNDTGRVRLVLAERTPDGGYRA